jgi:predicted N-acetyltransferase YhbS
MINETITYNKKVQIRLEVENDWKEVERLTREAFWKEKNVQEKGIGCDEHYLAHILRTSPDFLQELDFVAVMDDQIVGNIMYTVSTLELTNGTQLEVLTFGPLSVKPSFQNQGIGSALVTHSLKEAKRLGFDAVIIFGHPNYYPRFGFKEAKEFSITTKDGENFPAFMALELFEGSLHGLSASCHLSDVFDMDQAKAIEFDKEF